MKKKVRSKSKKKNHSVPMEPSPPKNPGNLLKAVLSDSIIKNSDTKISLVHSEK